MNIWFEINQWQYFSACRKKKKDIYIYMCLFDGQLIVVFVVEEKGQRTE